MQIKYWLDVYQLLSMRQLLCNALLVNNGAIYVYTCVHETCSEGIRRKTIWLFTGFPILALLQIIAMTLILFAGVVGFLISAPCLWCYKRPQLVDRAALYSRDGVEVTGHVSERWVHQDENSTTHFTALTYVEMDGTVVHMRATTNMFQQGYENGESVPMLVLPDCPSSGVPKRLIQERRFQEMLCVVPAEKGDLRKTILW